MTPLFPPSGRYANGAPRKKRGGFAHLSFFKGDVKV
jgi:hypothetical protein